MSQPSPAPHTFQTPIVWCKIPKCAGTSFQHFLRGRDLLYIVEDADSVTLEELQNASRTQVIQLRHAKLPVLAQRFPQWVEQAWVFVLVRNPWDRFISGWRYCSTTHARFLLDVAAHPPTPEEHLQDWHHITQPMSDAVCAKDGTPLMDHVVHIERLDEEMQPVYERLGFSPENFPHKNVSKRHTDFRLYYTPSIWKTVKERFQRDVELFGYDEPAPGFSWQGVVERWRMRIHIVTHRLLRRITRQS